MPLDDDLARESACALRQHGSISEAARQLGIPRQTLQNRLRVAAERGMLGPAETLPGYMLKSVSRREGDAWVKQVKAAGEAYRPTAGLLLKGKTSLVDADGRVIHQHIMERTDADAKALAWEAAVEELKASLPRITIMPAPHSSNGDLLNQFVVTDSHLGMLSWHEETGADYDLAIAEKLLLDWFAAAVEQAPHAHTAVLAQLGDLLHHDGHESVTPASKHVLDADSRLQKVIRVAIRTIRRIIDMLLQKHQHVHVVMASGNHDPASSAWLRELLAAMYENEPRISVDNSPGLYYAYEWGRTALFFHHGHKRGVGNVDTTLAGRFREMYGRSKYAYAHVGHLHSDEGRKSGLMYVERHETLAAPDAYAAGGGWLSGRSAKVVTYHRDHGEVGRLTLRPEMVAANDDMPAQRRAVA